MLFQCTSSGATMGIDSGFGSADMDCESRHISPKKTIIELPQSFKWKNLLNGSQHLHWYFGTFLNTSK